MNGLLTQLAGCFLAGLLAVLPAVLTLGIVVWVAGFVHRLIGRGTVVGNALVFMPTESVQPADMSVDGLMSIYVSMGITAPQFLRDQAQQTKSA